MEPTTARTQNPRTCASCRGTFDTLWHDTQTGQHYCTRDWLIVQRNRRMARLLAVIKRIAHHLVWADTLAKEEHWARRLDLLCAAYARARDNWEV